MWLDSSKRDNMQYAFHLCAYNHFYDNGLELKESIFMAAPNDTGRCCSLHNFINASKRITPQDIFIQPNSSSSSSSPQPFLWCRFVQFTSNLWSYVSLAMSLAMARVGERARERKQRYGDKDTENGQISRDLNEKWNGERNDRKPEKHDNNVITLLATIAQRWKWRLWWRRHMCAQCGSFGLHIFTHSMYFLYWFVACKVLYFRGSRVDRR